MAEFVTQYGILDIQVCVPREYTDDQAISFAEGEYPSGVTSGWKVRDDDPVRVTCSLHPENVHITMDA